MQMKTALADLEALRVATKPRLNKSTVLFLRDEAEAWRMGGGKADIRVAEAITLLLDMHDRLEAIRDA